MLTDREKVFAVWLFYGKSIEDPIKATEKATYHCCIKEKIPQNILTEALQDLNSFIEDLQVIK